MAAETSLDPLSGLDNLELAPQPGRDFLRRGISGKALGSAWPKLLAIVLALGIWELVYLSGFKSANSCVIASDTFLVSTSVNVQTE